MHTLLEKKKERKENNLRSFFLISMVVLTRLLPPLPRVFVSMVLQQVQAVFNPLAGKFEKRRTVVSPKNQKVFYSLLCLRPTFLPGLISIISLEIIRLEGNLGYFVRKAYLTCFRDVK